MTLRFQDFCNRVLADTSVSPSQPVIRWTLWERPDSFMQAQEVVVPPSPFGSRGPSVGSQEVLEESE